MFVIYLFIWFGEGVCNSFWPLLAFSIKNNQIPLPSCPSFGIMMRLNDVPQMDCDFSLDCYASFRILGSDSPFLFVFIKSLYYLLQPNVPSLPSLNIFVRWNIYKIFVWLLIKRETS